MRWVFEIATANNGKWLPNSLQRDCRPESNLPVSSDFAYLAHQLL